MTEANRCQSQTKAAFLRVSLLLFPESLPLASIRSQEEAQTLPKGTSAGAAAPSAAIKTTTKDTSLAAKVRKLIFIILNPES